MVAIKTPSLLWLSSKFNCYSISANAKLCNFSAQSAKFIRTFPFSKAHYAVNTILYHGWSERSVMKKFYTGPFTFMFLCNTFLLFSNMHSILSIVFSKNQENSPLNRNPSSWELESRNKHIMGCSDGHCLPSSFWKSKFTLKFEFKENFKFYICICLVSDLWRKFLDLCIRTSITVVHFMHTWEFMFLNQARAAKGRSHLVSWNCFGSCVSMRVSVSVSTPKGINNQWHDMVWYRPCSIG